MPGLPQYIEPLRLAESGEGLDGSVPVADLPRLASQLHEPGGTVDFSLRFAKDDQGFVRVRGEYSTELTLTCQRCLGAMTLRVANPINLAVVPGGTGVAQPPDETELLTLDDGRIHLAAFIEDEVLLALPMAPRHAAARCPRRDVPSYKAQSERNRPFAALKNYHPGKT